MKLIKVEAKFTVDGSWETLIPDDVTKDDITDMTMQAIEEGVINCNTVVLHKIKYKEVK